MDQQAVGRKRFDPFGKSGTDRGGSQADLDRILRSLVAGLFNRERLDLRAADASEDVTKVLQAFLESDRLLLLRRWIVGGHVGIDNVHHRPAVFDEDKIMRRPGSAGTERHRQ